MDPHLPLATQLGDLLANTTRSPARRPHHVLPGESAALLRALFYRLINIPEPPRPAFFEPLRTPPSNAHPSPLRCTP